MLNKTENKEFIVNEYISLKLEGTRTYIYVNGERFRQCMYILFTINNKQTEKAYKYIDSIDEAVEVKKRLISDGAEDLNIGEDINKITDK